jgi:hypothetical protein
MAFDIKTTLADMLDAGKSVAGGEWPKVRACVARALEEEKDFLQELGNTRLAGEIDDDTLAAQLRDERATLEAVLAVCQLMEMKLVQDTANAAIDVFNDAVRSALKPSARRAGKARAGRRPGRETKAAKKPLSASERRLNARPDTSTSAI